MGAVFFYLQAIMRWPLLTAFLTVSVFTKQASAQQSSPNKLWRSTLYAGVATSILDQAKGPSLAINRSYTQFDQFYPECFLFYENKNGRTFISGFPMAESAFGSGGGIRLNFLQNSSYNPSLFGGMGLLKYSRITSRPYYSHGTQTFYKLELALGFNTYHQISIGSYLSEDYISMNIRYGYIL